MVTCKQLLAYCYLSEAVAWSRSQETIAQAVDLLEMTPAPSTSFVEWAGSGAPAALEIDNGASKYVVVAGTTTAWQWAAQAAGSLLADWPGTGWKVNELYLAWLNLMAPALVKTPDTIFVGHSLGGAMAALLMSESRRQGIAATAVAIGAPRIGDAAWGAANGQWLDCAWVRGDPIPLVPPELLGYRHAGTLQLVGPAGKLTPTGPDPLWAPDSAKHFLSEYVERLSRCNESVTVDPAPPLLSLDQQVQNAANLSHDC